MAIEVKIPPMGESITSGVLAKWHVKNGDVVKRDQPLFELETDKITSEGTAESAGKITLKVDAGTEVKIGQVVALIDETVPGATASGGGVPPPREVETSTPKSDSHSPAVRRLAAETGLDPSTVTGTGKAGRVTKGDMLAASSKPPFPVPAAASPVATPLDEPRRLVSPKPGESGGSPSEGGPPPAAPGGGVPSPSAKGLATAEPREAPPATPTAAGSRQTRRKMTPLRQRIAQRLVQAQHEAAMLTTFNECDMSAVMGLRAKYQDDFVKKHGLKLGFMSFFTKAVVHALREVPAVNAQIDGDTIIQYNYFDIGVAVSTEKGLMVPVVRNCDQLGMAEIEKAIADAAKKARDGKITLADLEGGVFTITNGGIFGSMLSTPILNAPQSAILGLHAINERPVAVNGQVVIRPMMYLALSYDHRLVDGKEAVTFLVKVKQAIEDPARLAIGI